MPKSKYEVVETGSQFGGQSIAEWTIDWWKWAAKLPDDPNTVDNAFEDETGALAGQGYVGGPVFFVAATITTVDDPTPGEAHRHFFAPEESALLVPLLNTEVSFAGHDSGSVEEFLDFILSHATNVNFSIDGQSILNGPPLLNGEPNSDPAFHFERSDLFSFGAFDGSQQTVGYTQSFYTDLEGNQPAVGTELFPSEAGGWWVLITGLSLGHHKLAFGGTFDFGAGNVFTTKIVDDIIVVPERAYAHVDAVFA